MATSNRFALIGVAGFVAPRHLKAIKETGGQLIAAYDPHDSVGVLDGYGFHDASFFTEYERFDRFLELQRRQGAGADYVSICSPNFLHDAHIRLALRVGANAICEKPVVIKPWNIDPLKQLEIEHEKKVNVVLQLRLHDEIKKLRERILSEPAGTKHEVELRYVTPRGKWYDYSWKGDPNRSGGIAVNIGIHLFDLLLWLFGPNYDVEIKDASRRRISGVLHLDRARVSWFLSINREDLGKGQEAQGRDRSMVMDGEHNFDFTHGFEDLHTAVYREVMDGRGFSLDDAYTAIELTDRIRNLVNREVS